MPRINDETAYPLKVIPNNNDTIVGNDSENNGETVTFRLGSLLSQSGSGAFGLQDTLEAGNISEGLDMSIINGVINVNTEGKGVALCKLTSSGLYVGDQASDNYFNYLNGGITMRSNFGGIKEIFLSPIEGLRFDNEGVVANLTAISHNPSTPNGANISILVSPFSGIMAVLPATTANYADDSEAAASGFVAIGQLYHTAGVVKMRLT